MSEASSLTMSMFAFILSGLTDFARTELPRATRMVSKDYPSTDGTYCGSLIVRRRE